MYDGGGISPDITIPHESFSQITADLYAQNYIFDYANQYYSKNDTILPANEFIITDETYDEFKKYVNGKSFDYKTETEALLAELKSSAEREEYFTAINDQL